MSGRLQCYTTREAQKLSKSLRLSILLTVSLNMSFTPLSPAWESWDSLINNKQNLSKQWNGAFPEAYVGHFSPHIPTLLFCRQADDDVVYISNSDVILKKLFTFPFFRVEFYTVNINVNDRGGFTRTMQRIRLFIASGKLPVCHWRINV